MRVTGVQVGGNEWSGLRGGGRQYHVAFAVKQLLQDLVEPTARDLRGNVPAQTDKGRESDEITRCGRVLCAAERLGQSKIDLKD